MGLNMEPLWLSNARGELGVKEGAGQADNPRIIKYWIDSNLANVADGQDEVPWCAAFVGAMLKRAGGKGTGKLNARSYLEWGTPVDRKDAREGDVVIFKRGNSSWQGHVAFFVKDNGSTITVLGGNQADAVNRRAYPAASLLGIRRGPVASKPSQPVKQAPTAPPKPSVIHAPAKPAAGLLAWLWRLLTGRK